VRGCEAGDRDPAGFAIDADLGDRCAEGEGPRHLASGARDPFALEIDLREIRARGCDRVSAEEGLSHDPGDGHLRGRVLFGIGQAVFEVDVVFGNAELLRGDGDKPFAGVFAGHAHGVGTYEGRRLRVGAGVEIGHLRIGVHEVDVLHGDSKDLGGDLDDHRLVSLPVVDQARHERRLPVVVQLDIAGRPGPEAHRESAHDGHAAHADPVQILRLAPPPLEVGGPG